MLWPFQFYWTRAMIYILHTQLPSTECDLTLLQLHSIPLGSTTGHQKEEISTCLPTSSYKEATGHNEESLQSSTPKAEQTKGSQLLLMCVPFQILNPLCSLPFCTLLIVLCHFCIVLPKTADSTQDEAASVQHRAGQFLPCLAHSAGPDALQGTVCLACCLGTLLTHVQFAIDEDP